ncbi:TPA: hypothetical protein U1C79_002175 [Streptococcus suis]|nr:hypothetical protein [Streptococcus suis]HEM3676005.1 hypothetical protein [Streptococcus suis]
MRKEINVVWLEDEMEDAFSENLKTVEEAIRQKGYQPAVKSCEVIEEAREILEDNSKRIDFFISDYNLGEEEGGKITNGIDFLETVRKKDKYKQFFILYSKNYEDIKKEIIQKIEIDDNLALLNNTMVIDLSSPSDEVIKKEFQKAVEISLSKWDELNALRGEYMSENAEIEFELKTILKVPSNDSRNYKSYYNEFKRDYLSSRDKQANSSLLTEWYSMIDKRNALAHSKEVFLEDDGCFAISAIEDNSIKILESKIDEERRKLIELADRVRDIVKSHQRRITR